MTSCLPTMSHNTGPLHGTDIAMHIINCLVLLDAQMLECSILFGDLLCLANKNKNNLKIVIAFGTHSPVNKGNTGNRHTFFVVYKSNNHLGHVNNYEKNTQEKNTRREKYTNKETIWKVIKTHPIHYSQWSHRAFAEDNFHHFAFVV